MRIKAEPYLAFSCLLIMLIASSFMVQMIGFWINIPLVHYALPIAFFPCLWLTYGYFFQPSRNNLIIGIILAAILTALGIQSTQLLDFSMDAMSYHQPAADLILHGWNPWRTDSTLLPANVFPVGAWVVEASLAALYGSIEAAKMLNIWWIFIALPVVIAGIRTQFGALRPYHYLLALLLILNPVVIGQVVTHSADGLIYLTGITFIGAVMLRGEDPKRNQLSNALIVITLLFIIHTKFVGVYWGVMLCVGALAYHICKQRQLPWKMAAYLFAAGLVSLLIIGYHPFITNILRYNALLPWSLDSLIAGYRPSNLTPLSSIQRLFYGIFSATGGQLYQEATLKFPWEIKGGELLEGGAGTINGGCGPLFALGLLLSLALGCWNIFRHKTPLHKGVLCLTITLFVFSAAFPENWWARYSPFTYAIPLLLLLASARPHYSLYLICLIFSANSFITVRASYYNYVHTKAYFDQSVENLHKISPRSVYLVFRYGPIYETMNHGYIAIERRLHDRGIEITAVKGNGPCPNKAMSLVEFDLCYE